MGVRSSLRIPDAGPCARHPCDDCRTCQLGRCCRRDDPDYQLPALGDWDGPIHVPLGQTRSSDGVLLDCHACGRSYRSIGAHALHSHNLYAIEYRATFGLTHRQSLSGPDYRQRRAALMSEQIRSGRNPGTPPRVSAEQKSADTRRGMAVLRATGRCPGRKIGPNSVRAPGIRERVVERLRSGEPTRAIARDFGASWSAVNKLRVAEGIPRPPRDNRRRNAPQTP